MTAPEPLRRAIFCLIEAGRDLLHRLAAAPVPALGHIGCYAPRALPARFTANPARAEARITRALDIVFALARTLAGDPAFLPRPKLVPLHAARIRLPRPYLSNHDRAQIGLPPNPPRTDQARSCAAMRRLRNSFATEPVSRIARRLAARLNLKPGDDLWPDHLLAIAATPAECCAAARRAQLPPPTPEPPSPEPPRPEPSSPRQAFFLLPAAPSPHRRE